MITKGTPIDGVGFFALCRSEYSIALVSDRARLMAGNLRLDSFEEGEDR